MTAKVAQKVEQKKAEHQKAVVKKDYRTKAETREQAAVGIQKHQIEVENRQEIGTSVEGCEGWDVGGGSVRKSS